MLQTAMLIGNANNADICANLQPNSQMWQLQAANGAALMGRPGFGLPIFQAIECPSIIGFALPMAGQPTDSVIGGMEVSEQTGMRCRILQTGAGVATYQGHYGNFNKFNNIGNHSRWDGWPPPRPGGGSAAAS